MRKHDDARRAFLVGAVAGAGAVASAQVLPDVVAKADAQPSGATATQPMHAHAASVMRRAFFNEDDSDTVAAFAERLMPGAPGKPGATDAGVLNYIDLALAGAYADQQDFYRRGLAQLDAYCVAAYKQPFRKLDAAHQDEVIGALAQGKASGFAWPTAHAFFITLRTHTMEGMFADPIYGGNKDFAGWRLVGFPGAQPVFTPEDLASKQAFTAPIIGLQAQASTRKG